MEIPNQDEVLDVRDIGESAIPNLPWGGATGTPSGREIHVSTVNKAVSIWTMGAKLKLYNLQRY